MKTPYLVSIASPYLVSTASLYLVSTGTLYGEQFFKTHGITKTKPF